MTTPPIVKESHITTRKYQEWYCQNIHPINLGADVINHKTSMAVASYTTLVVPSIKLSLFKSHDFVSQNIISQGAWEEPEVSGIVKKMDSAANYGVINPVFLDIGSNIGFFSVNLAARGYETISIDAMRSNALMYRTTLCNNPEIMKRVTFYNNALGEESKTCYVFSGTGNIGDGMIDCTGKVIDQPPEGYVVRNTVDLVRLDNIVKQDIFVLKIDVEGYEMNVFKGAMGLFDNFKVYHVFSEFAPVMLHEGPAQEYLEFWIKRGYKISKVGFEGPYYDFSGHEGKELEVVGLEQVNIYCTHMSLL